jgi:hypothetical protein
MPQASPDYNFYVLKPNLVKEWHPSKNAIIKPREVTPGSGKKVWWICNKGHEWEAVVYSRSRGSGCPYCNHSKSADDSSFAVSSSELKMEWHPTANGSLTPTNVTIGDPDKVWWICREGHEWQATFKARNKGKGCPICDQRQDKNNQSQSMPGMSDRETVEWPDSMLEIEPLDNIFGTDFRKKRRFKMKATVTLEVPSSKHLFYAQLKNFSHEGMCVETSAAIKPGTEVNIKLDRPLFTSSQESYNSIIRWCKGLTDEDGAVYNFGLGVKFI